MHSSSPAPLVKRLQPSLSELPPAPHVVAGGAWLGALVPKRWAKRAVTRNLIKRQIYNVASLYESRFPEAALVVRLRAGFDRQHFVSAASDQLKKAVRMEIELLLTTALGALPEVLP